jgi:formylglycine-generating enzyme
MRLAALALALVASVGMMMWASSSCSPYSEGDAPTGAPSRDGNAGPSEDGSVDGNGTTTTDDAASDASGSCPTGLGPSMRVITPLDKSMKPFCVDRAEVTGAQYRAFREAASDLGAWVMLVPPACASTTPGLLSPTDDSGDRPRVNVSFCSAAFYCAAQGKRVCGAVGGAAVVIEAGAQAPTLEWEIACSNGDAPSVYPWGSTDPSAAADAGCLTSTTVPDASAPRPSGAAAGCGPSNGQGPYDMIGNVWEWVNVRQDGVGGSYTHVRGGSYGSATSPCNTTHALAGPEKEFAMGADQFGFRCCADAP